MVHAIAALGVVLAVVACDVEAPTSPALPALDEEMFRGSVQPILFKRCGNPSCHGNELRPFALYVPGAHRVDPRDVFLDPPLTDHEAHANLERTRAFCIDNGAAPELLSKPLAAPGGLEHRGGDIFESAEDREYRVIQAWLERREP